MATAAVTAKMIRETSLTVGSVEDVEETELDI